VVPYGRAAKVYEPGGEMGSRLPAKVGSKVPAEGVDVAVTEQQDEDQWR